MVTQATAVDTKKNGGNSTEDEFQDFDLSRPAYIASKCGGKPLQGIIFNVLGPFPAGRNAVNQDPWFAYEVKLTAPSQLVGIDKEVYTAPVGTVCMLPVSAHLKNLAPYVIQPGQVWAFRLSPGPQPKPQQMRVWKAQRGKAVARGNEYPLMAMQKDYNPLALPAAGEDVQADEFP
jgi:hypothetical protein